MVSNCCRQFADFLTNPNILRRWDSPVTAVAWFMWNRTAQTEDYFCEWLTTCSKSSALQVAGQLNKFQKTSLEVSKSPKVSTFANSSTIWVWSYMGVVRVVLLLGFNRKWNLLHWTVVACSEVLDKINWTWRWINTVFETTMQMNMK